jgi:hypothetical protein
MNKEQNIKMLNEFVINNGLTFHRSATNDNVTILVGFARYLNDNAGFEDEVNGYDVVDAIGGSTISVRVRDHVHRVWKATNNRNYGAYWTTEDAMNKYKFPQVQD